MTIELFISTLVASAAATSLAIQIIKNTLDAFKVTYKSIPLAVVVALAVGIAETYVYYGISESTITTATLVYALCMGVANAVGTTTSYDLVKKFIYALMGKTL